MRTAEETLEYIDTLISHMLERPKTYASTPESFEEILSYLDRLRDFVAQSDDSRHQLASYSKYLSDKGYNAMSFTVASRPYKPLTREDLDLFERTSRFFKEYLHSKQG